MQKVKVDVKKLHVGSNKYITCKTTLEDEKSALAFNFIKNQFINAFLTCWPKQN